MGNGSDYRAMAEPWADRVAGTYQTANGMFLDTADRQALASAILDKIIKCIILHIPADQWGFGYVNPGITEWESSMRLPRGDRLLSADESIGSVTMGRDPKAR